MIFYQPTSRTFCDRATIFSGVRLASVILRAEFRSSIGHDIHGSNVDFSSLESWNFDPLSP